MLSLLIMLIELTWKSEYQWLKRKRQASCASRFFGRSNQYQMHHVAYLHNILSSIFCDDFTSVLCENYDFIPLHFFTPTFCRHIVKL